MSQYIPSNVPFDRDALIPWLAQEFANIRRALTQADQYLLLSDLNKEPEKIADGMIVLADGANWDPGLGQGVYCYYNGAWNKLG